eukprot:m.481733 g.481733  ORF g.481733 m.481733 type:complete len:392 (+) comp22302_c0_seq1:352-1527(+)
MSSADIESAFRGDAHTEGTIEEGVLAEEIRTALRSVRLDTEWLSVKKQTRKMAPEFSVGRQNKARNRKSLPNDNTLVRLSAASGDPNDTYVNANFVSGWGTRSYIAAEAPLPEGIGSMWRMVVEHNVSAIVSLCPLNTPSVPRYLPKLSEPTEYAPGIIVTTDSEELKFAGLKVHNVTVQAVHSRHQLVHFAFEWPASGAVPQNASEFADLIDEVNAIAGPNQPSERPMLVHCFDGQGATGIFIAADIAQRRLDQLHQLDLPAIVMHMREQRAGLVPTVKHFRYSYEVLLPGAIERAKHRRENKTDGLGRRLSRKFSVEDFADNGEPEPVQRPSRSFVEFDRDAENVEHVSSPQPAKLWTPGTYASVEEGQQQDNAQTTEEAELCKALDNL